MGIIIRQSIKASIATYAGMAIGMVNVVILTTRYFSPQQVGLTRVLLENALLFTSLAQLGAPYIATRFFSYFKSEEKKHQGFLTFLLMYSLCGFLVFALLYFFSKPLFIYFYQTKSPELIAYYYFVLPLVFFNIYLSIIEAYSQVNGRIVVPTIVREVFLKLFNSFLIILFALNLLTFDGYILWIIFSYAFASVLILFYLKQMNWLHLGIDFSLLNPKFLKEMIIYGLFVVLGGVGYILSTKIDVLMLPALTNLLSTGIYVVAVFIAAVIEVPRRSISQITTPILAQALKENDMKKVEDLYKKSALNQLIAGSLLLLLIWCNIDNIFSIIPNKAIYSQGKWVVFFIALSRLIDMASGVNGEIIMNSKHYRFSLTSIFLLAIFTIVTNLIFIPLFGINGAALATAISILIFTGIKIIFVRLKFKIQPLTSKTFLVLTGATMVYLSTLFFPEWENSVLDSVISVILKSLFIAAAFGFIILKLKISEDMNSIFKTFSEKIKLTK